MPSHNHVDDKPQQRAEYSWESLQTRRTLTRDNNAEDNRGLSPGPEDEAPVYPPEIEDSDPDGDDNNNIPTNGVAIALRDVRRERSNAPSLSPARAMNSSPAPDAGGNGYRTSQGSGPTSQPRHTGSTGLSLSPSHHTPATTNHDQSPNWNNGSEFPRSSYAIPDWARDESWPRQTTPTSTTCGTAAALPKNVADEDDDEE